VFANKLFYPAPSFSEPAPLRAILLLALLNPGLAAEHTVLAFGAGVRENPKRLELLFSPNPLSFLRRKFAGFAITENKINVLLKFYA